MSSAVEKVNENLGHVKKRMLISRRQVVLLWQVVSTGVVLLHYLYLLSSYLKRDFEKSEGK